MQPDCRNLGRVYPEYPGPEVYIVGDCYGSPIVGTAAFIASEQGGCGGTTCRSDYLIYDLNDDNIPDGPISRIPAATVVDVQRATAFAHDVNTDARVDRERSVVLLAGDQRPDGTSIPSVAPMLDGIAADYQAVGYQVRTELSRSLMSDQAARYSAFVSHVNSGCREVFGVGGITDITQLPGQFAPCDGLNLLTEQRLIAWMPGCQVHASWLPSTWRTRCNSQGSSTQTFLPTLMAYMFNDPAKTGLAASVAHMDGGTDFRHHELAGYVSSARRGAATSGNRVSVARVAFDAVTRAIRERPSLREHALSLSVWGSYTVVPAVPYFAGWIAGPATRQSGESGTYVANVTGGVHPYSYTWYEWMTVVQPQGGRREEWVVVGNEQTYTVARERDFILRFEARDRRPAVTVAPDFVVDITDDNGGGGGCPFVDVLGDSGWVVGNSILARSLTGAFANDQYRLRTHPVVADGIQRLLIRENEQERTVLDRAGLIAVDHAPEVRAFAFKDTVVLGSRTPAFRVRKADGTDVTSLVDGTPGNYFEGRQGDTLLVEMDAPTGMFRAAGSQSECAPSEISCWEHEIKGSVLPDSLPLPTASAASAQTQSASPDASVLKLSGIRIETPDGSGGWRSIAHLHPREFSDESLVDSTAHGQLRVIFLARHRLRFVGRILNACPAESLKALALLEARHTRLGNVIAAVHSIDGVTAPLINGDTLSLSFASIPLGAGRVRDYVFQSHGVYTSVAATSQEASSAHAPLALQLTQEITDPARQEITVNFVLPQAGRVRMDIFDVQGRRVRELVDRDFAKGDHTIQWDQLDDSGSRTGSGIYLCRLVASGSEIRRKLILLRGR